MHEEVQGLEDRWVLIAIGVLQGKGAEVEIADPAPPGRADAGGDASGVAAVPRAARFRERRGDPGVAGGGRVGAGIRHCRLGCRLHVHVCRAGPGGFFLLCSGRSKSKSGHPRSPVLICKLKKSRPSQSTQFEKESFRVGKIMIFMGLNLRRPFSGRLHQRKNCVD